MSILLDKITEEEYQMMTKYRDWYAWSSNENMNCNTVSIRKILQASWEQNKQNLYHLLGDNLMIKQEFLYEKSSHEMIREFDRLVSYRETYGRSNRKGWEFINNFSRWYIEAFPLYQKFYNPKTLEFEWLNEDDEIKAKQNEHIRLGLRDLIAYKTLAENRYEGEPFIIKLKDEKKYTVSKGCKPLKVLAKIADAYGIDGFEDFRICHSLIHNQKKVSGEIVLSIHPLDYWTMSDNECGWDSCMNWQETGCYRQGTVEMMNSPSVIVAYMQAKTPMTIGKYEWNNKKWRQLFIVDKDIILGIKSYPYQNNELTITIINWIKELAEKNMGWSYFGEENDNNSPIKFDYDYITNPEHKDDTYKIQLSFNTNNMYSDIGTLDWHPLYLGRHIHKNGELPSCAYIPNYYNHGKPLICIDYNYSGDSQCMSCGELNPNFEGESYLCCTECQTSFRCGECGEYLCEDDCYWVDGVSICEYCYDEHTRECLMCETSHFEGNMLQIKIHIPVSKEYQEKLYGNGYNRPNDKDYHILPFLTETIDICEDCLENFKSKVLLDDKDIKIFNELYSFGLNTYSVSAADINSSYEKLEDILPDEFLYGLKKAQDTGNYDILADNSYYYLQMKKVKEKK